MPRFSEACLSTATTLFMAHRGVLELSKVRSKQEWPVPRTTWMSQEVRKWFVNGSYILFSSIFTPNLGEIFQFDEQFFSDGLVQPPTRRMQSQKLTWQAGKSHKVQPLTRKKWRYFLPL